MPRRRFLTAGTRRIGSPPQQPIANRTDPPYERRRTGADAADASFQVLDDTQLSQSKQHPVSQSYSCSGGAVVGEVQCLDLLGCQESVGSATYDPYGLLVTSSGTLSPLGFSGQYTDTESGLIYLRARYYDPVTAQFMTVDPALAATGQPYAYVANNPLEGSDPSGLLCMSWHCVKHAVKKVANNKYVKIAVITVGVVALAASGVGLVADAGILAAESAEAAEAAASFAQGIKVLSTVLSTAGTLADGAGCAIAGDRAACIGLAFNAVGVGGAYGAFSSSKLFAGLAGAIGFAAGSGGMVADIAAAYDLSDSPEADTGCE
jgi:RHS repeat-associated protein